MLAVVWGGALAGVALKLVWPHTPRWVSAPLYLALGWVAVAVLPASCTAAASPPGAARWSAAPPTASARSSTRCAGPTLADRLRPPRVLPRLHAGGGALPPHRDLLRALRVGLYPLPCTRCLVPVAFVPMRLRRVAAIRRARVAIRREDGRVTTRTLVIMRHAKAAQAAHLADVDRPLTPRGHADATAAGPWLSRRGYAPSLVLCSPARRTRETWQGVALGLIEAPPVRYDRHLYVATVRDLLGAVGAGTTSRRRPSRRAQPRPVPAVGAAGPRWIEEGLRTCGIAVHQMEGSWVECRPGRAPFVAGYTARA